MRISNNSRRLGRAAVFFAALQVFTLAVQAGGPSTLTSNHTPARWNPPQVSYIIDSGRLGPLSPLEAADQVRTAFQAWQNVQLSSITFEDRGNLAVDVTLANFDAYTDRRRPEGNPIIFDEDGSITDAFYGEGSDDVLGFATVVPAALSPERFDFAYAVLNGGSGLTDFRQTLVHELGHMIGLDHTQAGHAQFMSGRYSNVPIMYPYLTPFGTRAPLTDDEAWISWLYPESGFEQLRGTIKGRVSFASGDPLPGANVVAMPVTILGGVVEQGKNMVSVVSDFMEEGDGAFEIPGLPPGDYVVFIEPLYDGFIQGSGVGPYDYRFSAFLKDYFNGAAESGNDDTNERVVISVAAGQVVDNIDFVANEISNRLDLLTDDSEMRFKFPEGFRFPFFGKVYSEVYVNSDGNLTFGQGDGIPGEARDPERFLTGPPRIAPLFTDLAPDPAGPRVTAANLPGELTFTWEDVPEFSEAGAPPPNRFSVTLFANGDIRFQYEQIQVTPDEDPQFPAGLQAIVGVTPGNGSTLRTLDLSAQTSSIRLDTQGVYQIFPGNTFDLSHREVFFAASGTQLFFPFYRGDADNFSGYAVTNFGSGDALLEIQAVGPDGKFLAFPGNPRGQTVESGQQMAKLGSELFSIDMTTTQAGWVRILSSVPQVASFFQFGNGLRGPLTRMDGSVAVTAQSKKLFFTRIYAGEAVFPTLQGARNAETYLSVANPNASSATVRFTLFASGAGTPLVSGIERAIPGYGVLYGAVANLLGNVGPLSEGHIQVDVIQGEGVIGFELIDLGETVLGLNASYGNAGNTSYSAQLASGRAAGITVFTSLKIVNTASVPRVVTVIPYGTDGQVLSTPMANLVLQPNGSFQGDASQMFGFSLVGPETVGSLVIEASGPGVVGDVVFGDPERGGYAAALPVQTAPFKRAVFSQVANGSIDPADPTMDTFTGVAFFNPSTQIAQITLRVFDRNGLQVGKDRLITLGPRNRLSDLVENLVAGTSSLIQGYISIESSVPIVAQQLFGNGALTFLSAVPPQVIE